MANTTVPMTHVPPRLHTPSRPAPPVGDGVGDDAWLCDGIVPLEVAFGPFDEDVSKASDSPVVFMQA